MSFTAVIENGTIKLPPGVNLPDGTEVRIEPMEEKPDAPRAKTIAARYAELIGVVKDGPSDLADNHDHYLYGLPKRVP